MKHRFLLDENILYFAIYGIDTHDDPDPTATELIARIGANCHTIVVNNLLRQRYWVAINRALREGKRSRALEPVAFIVQLLKNSLKWSLQVEDCPNLPDGCIVPAEDVHIVRLALLSRANIVTADDELRMAVNHSALLGLHAMTPEEALVLALDT